MAELLHLKRLILSRYRQFRHCEIDLTDPETGTILPDLCLIGPNGCGKTTLLSELHRAIAPASAPLMTATGDDLTNALIFAKYATDGDDLYLVRRPTANSDEGIAFRAEIELSEKWSTLATEPLTFPEFCDQFSEYRVEGPSPVVAAGRKSAWFSPIVSLVDGSPADDFETFLEKRFTERDSEYHHYLKRPENREKTIAEVEGEFETHSPYLLTSLRDIWSSLLASSALRFDLSSATLPVITAAGEALPFCRLSPAIQRLLLQLGNVSTQYFGRELQPGALFLDTPEEGLHPDLHPLLIDFYRHLLTPQQALLLVATHSPLIAASFPPARLLEMKIGQDGVVSISPGVAPLENDPNQDPIPDPDPDSDQAPDPESDSEVGPAPSTHRATEARDERYSQLKRAIQESEDQDELADLIDEVMTIRKL